MYIYEIVKPGTWLESEDREWSREIEGIRKLTLKRHKPKLEISVIII